MEPTVIPWYKSPVYVGAITSLITQLLVLFGVADKVTPTEVSGYVDAGLQIVALVAAAIAAIQRQRSQVQPLALSKSHAEAKISAMSNEED